MPLSSGSGASPPAPGVAPTVASLAIAPVKGMRVAEPDQIEIGPAGPVGDRAFVAVGANGRLLRTTATPELTQVAPSWDAAARLLTLRFPDGEEVTEPVEGGEPASAALYNHRRVHGRLVNGRLADALSAHLGKPARLIALDPGQTGADDFPVTVMSTASLSALGEALKDGEPDARRFRISVTVDGVEAWEEHGWGGRELQVGEATLRVDDPVPRCVVTTRDPERGERDVPVLRALAKLRGKDDVTFGVWCEVVEPGRVRRGDPVSVLSPG